MGIDGRIFPVWAVPQSGKKAGELDFMDHWYPIQVKQKDKAGRSDIDSFGRCIELSVRAAHAASPRAE